jgi:hypothetical protein
MQQQTLGHYQDQSVSLWNTVIFDKSALSEIVLLSEQIPVIRQILQLNVSRNSLDFFLRESRFNNAVNS